MIYYNKKVRRKLLKGISKVYKATKNTFGPIAQYAILDFDSHMIIVDDGVSIVNSISLTDNIEQIGAKILIEAANQMNGTVGDGTTTTIIIAYALIKRCFKLLQLGFSPQTIISTIQDCFQLFTKELDKNVKKVNNINVLQKLFFVSTCDLELSQLFNQAINEVGLEGEIIVRSSNKENSYINIERGYHCNYGIYDNNINENGEINDPLIFISDITINSENLNILKNKCHKRNLLLIIKEIEREVKKKIIMNNIKNNDKIFVIKMKDELKEDKNTLIDLLTLTNTSFYSQDIYQSIEEIENIKLGECEKVLINSSFSTFFFKQTDKVIEYQKKIADEYKNLNNDYQKEELRKRIASFNKGVAYLYIGAFSDLELEKRKCKACDGIKVVQSSKEKGYCLGGGKEFLKIAQEMRKEINSYSYIRKKVAKEFLKAITFPFFVLCQNSNVSLIKRRNIKKDQTNRVYDFSKSEWTNDTIFDSYATIINSVAISISIANTFINTYTIIIKEKVEENNEFEKIF